MIELQFDFDSRNRNIIFNIFEFCKHGMKLVQDEDEFDFSLLKLFLLVNKN